MIIDVDEYVYSRNGFSTVPQVLARMHSKVNLIQLPWKRFGSSGIFTQPRSVITNFVRRQLLEERPSTETKSLFRLSGLEAINNGSRIIWHQHRASSELSVWLPRAQSFLSHANPLPHESLPMQGRMVRGPFKVHQWSIHINHYVTLSCEYFQKVRRTRGSVTKAQKPTMRTMLYLAGTDNYTNAVVDDELKTKRGPEWESALPMERPWPTRAFDKRHQWLLNTTSRSRVNVIDCGSFLWNATTGKTHVWQKGDPVDRG